MVNLGRSIKIFALLLLITGLFGHLDGYFKSPINLYASDQNYTAIFNQARKDNNMIGILFTNKFCKDCYAN